MIDPRTVVGVDDEIREARREGYIAGLEKAVELLDNRWDRDLGREDVYAELDRAKEKP